MIKLAKRLDNVQEYYFSKKLREVQMLIEQGQEILNLGIGSPDLPPPPEAVEALHVCSSDLKGHRYQSYKGIPELRSAIADFYKKQFEVSLDPSSEILPLMGSKEGIMHISMTYLNPGDKVLIPNPGYPTYSSVTKLLQAETITYELKAENNWLPDIEALERLDLNQVKIMWINYPNMPTGAVANRSIFEKLIAFTKKHSIMLVNDNPYSLILNERPLSLLSLPGAMNHCLELNSLSKSFNMSGWRVGMVLGQANHISNILRVKSNMDSGMFLGIQKGAIKALQTNQTWIDALNQEYSDRHKILCEIAEKLGCTFKKVKSGMFLWARIPLGENAIDFSDKILSKHKLFITPGSVFGTGGEGYLRFSLCTPIPLLQKALDRLL
jgi:LL-diaminopimelate aminotransferase